MNLTGYIIGVSLGLHHGYFLGVAILMVFIGVGQGLVLGLMTVEGVSILRLMKQELRLVLLIPLTKSVEP